MAYRLLLADDSITIQKVVELTLSEEDFEVTACGDGVSALEAARRRVPDIILADVFMPGMDGYELCGTLRQDPALRDVPVLLLVGSFENFDYATAARVGADDHIIKPFESAELVSKVKRLVAARGARPQEELVAEFVEEAEPVLEAGFVEEAELSGELMEAEPAPADDLWSVVDLQSESRPITGATEILTEEELWRRANLVSEPREYEPGPALEEGLRWDEISAEPVMEAEEAEEVLDAEEALDAEDALTAEEYEPIPEVLVQEGPEAEATAILDLDDLGAYTFAHESPEEPAPAEVAEPYGPAEMLEVESLDEATVSNEFESPGPAAEPVTAAPVSPETLKEEILKAVNPVLDQKIEDALNSLAQSQPSAQSVISSILDQKIKEALSAISKDVIEQVVWDVVPALAEEIIVKEIEKLKAGIK